MTPTRLLRLILLLIFLSAMPAYSANEINECGTIISDSGKYTPNQDLMMCPGWICSVCFPAPKELADDDISALDNDDDDFTN